MNATHLATEKLRTQNSMMRRRQRPLMKRYAGEPEAARITDGARTVPGAFCRHDPVHGELRVGTSHPIDVPLSIHSAVGGDHDGPNPGDYLVAALVGCFDTTLRILADRFGIELAEFSVEGRAEIDVRGTLCVSPDVPVGFQRLELNVHLRAPDVPAPRLQMLIAATEHCCVVLQTLKGGVPIDVLVDGEGDGSS